MAVVLAVTLLILPGLNSMAAETREPYRATISAGLQGKFADGSDKKVFQGRFDFAPDNIIVNANEDGTPSKYYVKGIRISGREDLSYYAATHGEVLTEDKDYVVVYGIKGEQVEYTVKYVDKNGKELAPADTFTGNVGDKPVVACKYIAGYAPQAFKLTKTLVSDAGEGENPNVFKFVYVPSEINHYKNSTEYVDAGTNVIYVGGGTVVVPGGTAAGGGNASNVTGGGAGGNAEGAGAEGEGAEGAGEGTSEGPQEIIDLDDEEVPLAEVELDGDKELSSVAVPVVIGGISLAALIVLIILFIKKRLEQK